MIPMTRNPSHHAPIHVGSVEVRPLGAAAKVVELFQNSSAFNKMEWIGPGKV